MYTPGPIPDAPSPETARPTISVVEFWATPQIRLPISKMKIATRKLVLSGKYLNTLPHCDWNAPSVKKYAEPYHEISSRLSKWSVIFGIAVAKMVCFDRLAYSCVLREGYSDRTHLV
jgi:hypothetical protein